MSRIDLSQLPSLQQTLQLTDFRARKALGQNFLLDVNITRRIARQVQNLDTGTIIEIGSGPGGLTRGLFAEGACHVVCIDPDVRSGAALDLLRPALHTDAHLTFLNADVLTCDLTQLGTPPRQIVANIPYNITSPILIQMLKTIDCFTNITIMIQKEVAERLGAIPRTKNYGRLSVITQWCCEVTPLFNVPASAFTPVPKVDSTVIQLTPRKTRIHTTFSRLEKLTHCLFQQRRKMLRGTLKQFDAQTWEACIALGILPTQRPEELDIKKMCALANFLDN